MSTIDWEDFKKIDLRAGTIISAEKFTEAKKKAYKLRINFGSIGVKQSSAQITDFYQPKDLIGKQVIAVVNFPPKKIANFWSECLVTGFVTAGGPVVLATSDNRIPNGTKLA